MTNIKTDPTTFNYETIHKIQPPEINTVLVDFSKPMIWNNNRAMVVIDLGPTNRTGGHHLIKLAPHPSWTYKDREYYVIVDSYGNDIEHRNGDRSSRHFNRVFNLPEEKYDTLVLYRHKCSGKWNIDDSFDVGRGPDRQYLQRSVAEKYIARQAPNTIYEYKFITIDPI